MSSIINFDYKGSQISFEKGKNVMVNLTSMAKPFPEKNLTQIINSQEINDYCISLSKLQNYSLADLLIVRRGGNNNGTWAHRLVAIRVAQKLNSDFAVWVDMRIEELLTTGVATVSNDDEARAKLIIRWEQLETEKQKGNTLPGNYLEALKSLFDPKALAGKKMKHGLREVIGASLGFVNKSTISDNMSNISDYYDQNSKFRKDAKQAYMYVSGLRAN